MVGASTRSDTPSPVDSSSAARDVAGCLHLPCVDGEAAAPEDAARMLDMLG